MIKKGDKVRFLNSVGGGIVRGFRDKHTAWVEDESGFEFPVSVSECVVVDEGGGTARNSLAAREERSLAVEVILPSEANTLPIYFTLSKGRELLWSSAISLSMTL